MRGAYESAALAVWLLEPEAPEDRLARLIAQHVDSWKYSEKAYRATSPDDDGIRDLRWQEASQMGQSAGISQSVTFPGFEKLIESVDDFPGRGESFLTAWQLCSGVSHANTWALNQVTTREVNRVDQSEHLHLSARVPDRSLAISL